MNTQPKIKLPEVTTVLLAAAWIVKECMRGRGYRVLNWLCQVLIGSL